MPVNRILWVGDSGAGEFSDRLGERPASYTITTTTAVDGLGARLPDADCVVAVHEPPAVDAREVLRRVRRESQSIPVVVYAVTGSETVAMAAVNEGASRYVRAGDRDSRAQLADAVVEVTDLRTPAAEPDLGFHPGDIVQRLPTATFVLNDRHEVIYWNEACEQLLEYDAEEVLGTTHPFEAFYDEPRPVMADLVLEDADAEDISEWYDDWYESPYGNESIVGEDYFPEQDIWLRFAAAPLRDASGDIRGAIETLEEITQRKSRKEQLERYETIIEASSDPVYTLDADGRITFVNDKVVELTGYGREELLGSHVSMVVSDEDIEAANRRISELLTTDTERTTVEMDIVTAEGDRRTCENHIALLPADEADGLDGTVGVIRDITERKQRERELRQFENAVDHAGHAVMITDTDGTIEYVNPAFEEMTGYTAGEACGRTPAILSSGEHDRAFYRDLWGTIRDGEIWEGEIVNQRASGERFVVSETVAPIEGREGTIKGFVGIMDEITARKLREQQLDVFHRVLRHTLRNKGTAIKGHTDLLQQDLEDESRVERLETIQENVQSLIDISEKAHHVRQVVADALDADTHRKLCPTVERITTRLAATHPEAEVTIDDTSTAVLRIDARATHALHELVENAVSHSDASPPQVTVSVTNDASTATVTISDNGPGIPDEERRVLEAGTETPLEHSSGLGLWFAHWLIHYVGGDITIDVDETGTTVVVTLPLVGV